MATQALQANLNTFGNPDAVHPFSEQYPEFALTDGTQCLAEEANAFWLMELIASHKASYKNEECILVELTQRENDCQVNLTGKDGKILATQDIEHNDFPLKSIKLNVIQFEGYTFIAFPWEC